MPKRTKDAKPLPHADSPVVVADSAEPLPTAPVAVVSVKSRRCTVDGSVVERGARCTTCGTVAP
jgi:hypothetical protein